MNAKSRRIFSAELKKHLKRFNVELEFKEYHDNKKQDFMGRFIDDDNSEFTKVHEPLIVFGTSAHSTSTNQLELSNGSSIDHYDYQWYSWHDLPTKTIVKYNGHMFEINKKSELDNIGGIYIYFITGRSDLDVELQS